MLDIANQIGDIADGVPKVRQGPLKVKGLGDLLDLARTQPVMGYTGQHGMQFPCGCDVFVRWLHRRGDRPPEAISLAHLFRRRVK